MIIQHGNVSQFQHQPWSALEIQKDISTDDRMEVICEEVLLGISRWMAKNDLVMEVFFPVSHRGIDGVQLLSPYLWVRGNQVSTLNQAISHRRSTIRLQPFTVEDSFVQSMILLCRSLAKYWSNGIGIGSYVRVLYGSYRMFCGRVTKITNGIACVDIQLRVRLVRLTIPLAALENLGTEAREYFYTGC